MKALRRWFRRSRFALLHLPDRADDRAMEEELESHIEMQTEENIRRGMAPQEARRMAVLKFGSVESTKESYRDQRSLPVVETVAQDLRYTMRGIRKNPGFALIAILSLAIGIGANTAIFSLVNGVLLEPLRYKDPERVFAVRELLPRLLGQTPIPVNTLHAREWARQSPSVEDVALMRGHRIQVSAGGEPESVPGMDVSSNLFPLLGVEPIVGRVFLADEDQQGRDSVAVLSEMLWRSRFNADPAIAGKSVLLDGREYQVVGVMPASLRLPYYGGSNVRYAVFRPLVVPAGRPMMGDFNYAAIARLKRGTTAEQALSEINVIEARFPTMAGEDQELKAILTPAHDFITGSARLGLWTLSAAVGSFLLIVCVNLANLLLSRIASRRREAAIRTALGASRGRQFRQVLAESMLLAVFGGILGILFAGLLVQMLTVATTLGIPRLDEVRLDARVVVFAIVLTGITGLVFGALPAWRLTRHDPQEALRAGSHTVTEGRRGLRLREGLIGLEVALSAALLIIAGLLGASLDRLLHVDKGFDAAHVLTVDIRLVGNAYTEPVIDQFFQRVLAGVGAIHGVQALGIITTLPTSGESWMDPIYLAGASQKDRYSVNNRYASPGYFETMNIAIAQGRPFAESDRGKSVAVLSQKAARLLWPGQSDVVGRQFVGEDGKSQTVVGIAAEVRAQLHYEPPPMAYYPYWQRVPGGVSLVVRSNGDPLATAAGLRTVLRSEDAKLAIPAVRTMEDLVDGSVSQRRFQVTLMRAFAASALLVASLGIYGVVSYSVTRRWNEIGIRMALGARRSGLFGLVIRQGMTPVVAGLFAGVVFALLVGRTIRGLLFGIQPSDPLTIAGVAIVLLVVGLIACWIPARRAAGMNVVTAIRFE